LFAWSIEDAQAVLSARSGEPARVVREIFMRLFLLLGCVTAALTGCDTTKCCLKCTPCSQKPAGTCPAGTCSAPAAPTTPPAAIPPSKNGPSFLPPKIQEVRGEELGEPRMHASATNPAMNQDVLLIPRWVYVPYVPHAPTGPSKLPANVAGPQSMGPYVSAGNQMTVLPPMGGPSMQNDTMEQCLAQMKMMNARLMELEAREATKSTMPASYQSAPQALPLPPLPAPVSVPPIPPAK
jgi:hypothetical protein